MKNKILLIDACTLTQKLLKEIGEKDLFSPYFATTADDGLLKAMTLKPDIIVMETTIEGQEGLELLAKLKNNPISAHIPIIFLSSNQDIRPRIQALSNGAADFIIKPVFPNVLSARINVILDTIKLQSLKDHNKQIDVSSGLWNQEHFRQRLSEELASYHRYNRNFCLAIIDATFADATKTDIEQLQKVLNQVSNVLFEHSRGDDISCRLDSGRLAILMPGTGMKGGKEKLEHILLDLSNTTNSDNNDNSNRLNAAIIATEAMQQKQILSPKKALLIADKLLKQFSSQTTQAIAVATDKDFELTEEDISDDDRQMLNHELIQTAANTALAKENQLSHALIRIHEFSELLHATWEQMLIFTKTEHGICYIIDYQENRAKCSLACGLLTPFKDRYITLTQTKNQLLFNTEKPVIIDNKNSITDFFPGFDAAQNFHALAVIPIMLDQRLITVFGLANATNTPTFDPSILSGLVGMVHLHSLSLKYLDSYRSSSQDLLELRMIQNELEQAKRVAEDDNLAKSRFLANMSHELRTPLNAILGYGELLLEEMVDDNDNEQNKARIEDISTIVESGKHLLNLIGDVLDYSKIEARKAQLFLETFRLDELLRILEDTIKPSTIKANNQLTITNTAIVETMHSDYTKIKQILINLLSNAIKFTQNGVINLSVSQETNNNKVMVIFRIEDNGIGMTSQQLERVFDAYTQATKATTKKHGGTGLGLAISRSFCGMLGGELTVTSTYGKGSIFSVFVPAISSSSKSTQATVGNHITLSDHDSTPKILVIGTLAELCNKFKSQGISYHNVTTIEEAMTTAIKEYFDIILFHMQQLFDLEGCLTLNLDERTCRLPIVGIASTNAGFGMTDALDAGAIDFYNSPFHIDEVVIRLNLLIRNKRNLDVLEKQTQLDAVTKLWNRDHFFVRIRQRIESLKRYKRHFTVVMIEIGNLREIRETYGCKTAINVLEDTGNYLTQTCRTNDIACRIGLRVFAMILPETSDEASLVFIKRVKQYLSSYSINIPTSSSLALNCHFALISSNVLGHSDSLEKQGLAKKAKYLIDIGNQALELAKDNGINYVGSVDDQGKLILLNV